SGNAELPPHVLATRGGLAAERSQGPAPPLSRLQGETRLELILVPETPVSGNVAVAAFLGRGGTLRPWPASAERIEIAGTGAVRLEVRDRDFDAESGPMTLWLAVARPRELPSVEVLPKLIASGGDRRVRLLSQEILLGPEAPSSAPGGSLPSSP
ncbi:MAG: hypothetical protein KDD47_22930, partial [Acidobacteria bacterium]|nr:hypothetical protein [Acidobacteriota bacterium]